MTTRTERATERAAAKAEADRNVAEQRGAVRALTVQQPWAWAIVHGGKDVENRTQAWGYRGPLAIHAGARISQRGNESPLVRAALEAAYAAFDSAVFDVHKVGSIIGVVDLVGVHHGHPGCCDSPWAETSYDEHGGRTRRDIVHLELANPRPFEVPIPCKGRLGLWTPPAEVLEQLELMTTPTTPAAVVVSGDERSKADG